MNKTNLLITSSLILLFDYHVLHSEYNTYKQVHVVQVKVNFENTHCEETAHFI